MNKAQFAKRGVYDKQTLTTLLAEAVEKYERGYENTLFNKDINGKVVSSKRAVDIRAVYKKNLCIMYLVNELLEKVDDNFEVSSEQAALGFDRLIGGQ